MHNRRFACGLPPRAEKPRADVAAPAAAERLQKVLAAAGLGSRRKCEDLILEGRVEVDGRVVNELGTKVDPDRQKILVDGEALPRTKLEYYAVYKPTGVVTTNYDQEGRPRVIDLVPDGERLFPIGRLDLHSEGLILVTNDGELTNRLAHPRYGVEKTYHAIVAGMPETDTLDKLRHGVHLAEGFAHAKQVTVRAKSTQSTLLEIVLDEGRNREIRRLLARVGHKVLKLKRIGIGPLKIGEMTPGQWRRLSPSEVQMLYDLVSREPTAPSKKPARPRKPYAARGAQTAVGRSAKGPMGGRADKRPLDKVTAKNSSKRPFRGKEAGSKSPPAGGGPKVRRRPKPVKKTRRELPEE